MRYNLPPFLILVCCGDSSRPFPEPPVSFNEILFPPFIHYRPNLALQGNVFFLFGPPKPSEY